MANKREKPMRTLLVFGEKTFKITVPDDARVTFGPWSPPSRKNGEMYGDPESRRGTLRVYKGSGQKETNIIACFTGVRSFRDLSIGYAEEVAREEGSVIWKDDEKGYSREEKKSR